MEIKVTFQNGFHCNKGIRLHVYGNLGSNNVSSFYREGGGGSGHLSHLGDLLLFVFVHRRASSPNNITFLTH